MFCDRMVIAEYMYGVVVNGNTNGNGYISKCSAQLPIFWIEIDGNL